VLIGWSANFQNATPGKPLVSFIAQADGFDLRRSIQQIFVSQTRFNPSTNTYTCTVGEGTLAVSKIGVITAAATWGKGALTDCKCGPGTGGSPSPFPPNIPVGMTMVWTANPAYAGTHGDLPFADPWWKILAIIVAVIAAIVGVIAAAAGAGAFNISVGGTFDETQPTVNCCNTKGIKGPGGYTVAGIAGTICSGAIAAACSDLEDPFYRGQTATPPAPGELTIGEQVVAKWDLPQAPAAGAPYTADIRWTYTRFTTGKTYTHSVTETMTNVHTAGPVTVTTPNTVSEDGELWVEAQFAKSGGGLFSGKDLYAFALFQTPQQDYDFFVLLSDDGVGFDKVANDGTYSGGLRLEGVRRQLLDLGEDVAGLWRVFIFAQDVNLTIPGTAPVVAAQQIGGMFVASSVVLTFDPNLPCPMKALAAITVI
jgi:hypothetical protein